MKYKKKLNKLLFYRDDRIRTCDPMLPKHMRYQTALHPEIFKIT